MIESGPAPRPSEPPPFVAPVRRGLWRRPWFIAAAIVVAPMVVAVNLWAGVTVWRDDKDGRQACLSIDRYVELGTYTELSATQMTLLSGMMIGSRNEELAALGRAYQRKVVSGIAETGDPYGVVFPVDALVEVTRAPCAKINADALPWPF